ncbi:MAG: acetyl-CoA carboxylase biotin carboxyl carrier protein subunit [Saprospiraceae bacterium]
MQGKNLKIQINSDREESISMDQIAALDIVSLGGQEYQLLRNGKSYRLEVLSADIQQKIFKIRVEGKIHHIKLEDQYDMLVKTMGFEKGQKRITDIKAPMPGLVREVLVKVGDHFEKGQTLVVLEAMKMENALKAAAEGTVKSVHVSKDQTVDKGMILIGLE